MKHSVSIIIPNFNGRRLLEKNLPSVIAASAAYGGEVEIIVVDDASADDSVQWLADKYGGVIKIVRRDTNGGFSKAIASGVEAAVGDTLYFLNSDIRVSEDFLKPVISRFFEEDVLAVSSMAYDNEGIKIAGGRAGLHWRWGRLDVDRGARHTPSGVSAGPTLFASGGHSAYRRDAFLQLGGFDEIFSPFYWEDVDLCLKAWKRGRRILFEPQSVVFHDHQSTIGGLYSRNEVQKIRIRNHFILNWRNLTDRRLLFSHAASIPLMIIISKLAGPGPALVSLLEAIKKLPAVFAYRREAKKVKEIRADREIVDLFRKEFYSTPGVCIFDGGGAAVEARVAIAAGLRQRGIRVEFCSATTAGGLKKSLTLAKQYFALSREFDAIYVNAGIRTEGKFASFAGKIAGVPVLTDSADGDVDAYIGRIAAFTLSSLKDSGRQNMLF